VTTGAQVRRLVFQDKPYAFKDERRAVRPKYQYVALRDTGAEDRGHYSLQRSAPGAVSGSLFFDAGLAFGETTTGGPMCFSVQSFSLRGCFLDLKQNPDKSDSPTVTYHKDGCSP